MKCELIRERATGRPKTLFDPLQSEAAKVCWEPNKNLPIHIPLRNRDIVKK